MATETKEKYGMIHVLYGAGRGKTTSAMGLAVRAAGAGLDVDIVQFMKDGKSSEVEALKGMQKITYYCPGFNGFVYLGAKAPKEDISYTAAALNYSRSCSAKGTDLLVCDEILNAVMFGLLSLEEVLYLIEQKRPSMELVLTGLYCPDEIRNDADYCSEIREVKHPYKNGIKARLGIEY